MIYAYSYLKLKEEPLSEDWVSRLDVLIQPFKTAYFHLTNKKKELKKFLEYINANNLYKLRILAKNKMINRCTSSSSTRLAACRKLRKILGICISIINKRMKRIVVA